MCPLISTSLRMSSALRASARSLGSLMGYSLACQPEWDMPCYKHGFPDVGISGVICWSGSCSVWQSPLRGCELNHRYYMVRFVAPTANL